MSAQRLSDKNTKKIAKAIGLDVVRAWAHGGYTFDFVTSDHIHGWYEKITGEFGVYDRDEPNIYHYTTCPDKSEDWNHYDISNG
jgi:hypothetical protein